MSKIGKILAVVGAALGVIIGLLLGRNSNRRGSSRDIQVSGGVTDHIDSAVGGITEAGDIIENVTQQLDSGTDIVDNVTNGLGTIESNSGRISDILQNAKDRNDNNSDT